MRRKKESNTVKGAGLLNLRHPRSRFKSYPNRTSLVRYDLNLNLGCHRFYYLEPLPVLDPIYLIQLWFCIKAMTVNFEM